MLKNYIKVYLQYIDCKHTMTSDKPFVPPPPFFDLKDPNNGMFTDKPFVPHIMFNLKNPTYERSYNKKRIYIAIFGIMHFALFVFLFKNEYQNNKTLTHITNFIIKHIIVNVICFTCLTTPLLIFYPWLQKIYNIFITDYEMYETEEGTKKYKTHMCPFSHINTFDAVLITFFIIFIVPIICLIHTIILSMTICNDQDFTNIISKNFDRLVTFYYTC